MRLGWEFWVYVVIPVIGVVSSVLYGWKAFEIFGVDAKGKTVAWQLHRRCFYTLGVLFGWVLADILVYKLVHCARTSCSGEIGFEDILLVIGAFAGITGHFSFASTKLLEGLASWLNGKASGSQK